MSTVTDRVRRHRQRQRQGKIVLLVEADEAALAFALTEARLLDPTMADDRDHLAAGLERLIDIVTRYSSSPDVGLE
jgi:hypothetical protein